MPSLARPEVILTHESDLDGLVSGLLLQRVAQRIFEVDVDVEAYNYQGWKNRALRENVAWVSDFAFEPRMDRSGWLVLDHHTSNFAPKIAHLVHDSQKSAARLCYDLAQAHGLGSLALDRIVHLTNLGDLFLEDDPDFALACDYASLVKTYGFWNLHQILGGKLETLLDHPLLEVMSTKRRVEDPIGFSMAVKNVVELSPTVATVRPPVGNSNLIVHRLLNHNEMRFRVLATIFRKGAGNFVVSFRSRHGEALAVAQKFEGGGGHRNASGATLPRGIASYEDALEYLRLRLNVPVQTASEQADEARLNAAFMSLKWPA